MLCMCRLLWGGLVVQFLLVYMCRLLWGVIRVVLCLEKVWCIALKWTCV